MEDRGMNRACVGLLLLGFSQELVAAFQEGAPGPVAAGMGNASVAVSGSLWGISANPSLLSERRETSLSITFSPHRFGLSELAAGGLLHVCVTPVGVFGATISHTGFALYREIVGSIAGGWQVLPGLQAGVSIRYFHLAIEGYGTDQAFGVQLGLLAILTTKLKLGFSASNLNSPVIGEGRERLPQVYRTGISFQPVSDLEIAIDLLKDIHYPLELHAGFQYKFLSMLALRAGTAVEPSLFSAGVGMWFSDVSFDYAFTHHSVLGITHHLALNIAL